MRTAHPARSRRCSGNVLVVVYRAENNCSRQEVLAVLLHLVAKAITVAFHFNGDPIRREFPKLKFTEAIVPLPNKSAEF